MTAFTRALGTFSLVAISFFYIHLAASDSYQYFRFELDATSGPLTQLAELKFLQAGDVPVQPTSYAARGENLPDEGLTKLFDGNVNTKWLDFSNATWVQVSFAAPVDLRKYIITSANDSPQRDPASWTLAGSNDGSTWITIDAQINQSWLKRFFARTFVVGQPSVPPGPPVSDMPTGPARVYLGGTATYTFHATDLNGDMLVMESYFATPSAPFGINNNYWPNRFDHPAIAQGATEITNQRAFTFNQLGTWQVEFRVNDATGPNNGWYNSLGYPNQSSNASPLLNVTVVNPSRNSQLEWWGAHSIGTRSYEQREAGMSASTRFFPGQTISLRGFGDDEDGILDATSVRIEVLSPSGTVLENWLSNGSDSIVNTEVPFMDRQFTFPASITGNYAFRVTTTMSGASTVNTWTAPVILSTISAPTISLTSPSAGATINLSSIVALSVSASPSGGIGVNIVKVEYFNGETKLGESATVPYGFNWIPSSFGPASITARVTDSAGATATSTAVVVTIPAIPFGAGFDTSEGYSEGSLGGQVGWAVSAGSAQVTASGPYSGDQALALNPEPVATEVDRAFPTSGASVVYADLFTRPVAGASTSAATTFDCDAARIAFVQNGSSGQFWALDGDGFGNGVWKLLPPLIPLDVSATTSSWKRLSVRLDYATRKYDVYLDGEMIAFDLNFRLNSATYFSWFSMKGHVSAVAWLDSLQVTASNPLFTDVNNDGMPDDLDRYGDADEDGLNNISEFSLHTDPHNPDSDGDDMPDGWEHTHGLDPLDSSDARIDSDGDGVLNIYEFRTGGNPRGVQEAAGIPSKVLKIKNPANQYYKVSVPLGVLESDAGP